MRKNINNDTKVKISLSSIIHGILYIIVRSMMKKYNGKTKIKPGDRVKLNWKARVYIRTVYDEHPQVRTIQEVQKYANRTYCEFKTENHENIDGADVFWLRKLYWWERLKIKKNNKKYYRLAHVRTGQGLWYNSQGEFTGLIHNEFKFCKNNSLPMPFDPKIVGWLSAVETLEDLFNWFPKEDILILENYGYFITEYRAKKVRKYKNHLIICQKTSIINRRIPVDFAIQELTFN